MKVHEYQAMLLFSEYGIKTVPCELADKAEGVAALVQEMGSKVVVKSQVLVGGRGKAGGIKLASSPQEAEKFAEEILSMEIKSIPVEKVLISEAVDILKEYYLGITIDRASKRIVFIASAAGGVEIEVLAENSPEQIHKMFVDPLKGINDKELKNFVSTVFNDDILTETAFDTMRKLYKLFIEKDCSLVEINPYVKISPKELVAIDAKINFDDNAVFKHPDVEKLRNPEEYSQDEIDARENGLSFVSMEGNIGCIVNGAGLAMATMDVIKLFGGEAANFLDVGGSSNPEKVLNALKIILSNPKVKAVLINIFGGITRCDDIANGIVMAKEKIDIKVPMVIRLVGTNEKEGLEILKKAGLTAVSEMSDAVEKVVKAAE